MREFLIRKKYIKRESIFVENSNSLIFQEEDKPISTDEETN